MRILLFTADDCAPEQTRRALRKSSLSLELRIVADGGRLASEAIEFRPDLVLADTVASLQPGISVIDLINETCPGVPLIAICGEDHAESALRALKAGAVDYLCRGQLSRLPVAIQDALHAAEDRRRRIREDATTLINEERRRYFFSQTAEGFYRLDFDPPVPVHLPTDEIISRMYAAGYIGECNRVFAEMYGFATPEAMSGVRLVDLHGGSNVPENVEALRDFVHSGYRHMSVETVEITSDGQKIYLSNNAVGIVEDGYYLCCWGTQRDITAQHRAEQGLRHSHQQLRALLARLRRAQEDERARVSREIHDQLGQLLTGLKLDVSWLERRLGEADLPVALNPVLDRAVAASELVDQTIASVQEIAAIIRPGVLYEQGLAQALRLRAHSFEERSDIPVRFTTCEPEPLVPTETANELYNICQEALTNVARHSRADSVNISLQEAADEIVLEVCDDGRGFDLSESRQRQSLGLIGMEERALQIGGTLEIEPAHPQGTRVRVRAPIRQTNTSPSDCP